MLITRALLCSRRSAAFAQFSDPPSLRSVLELVDASGLLRCRFATSAASLTAVVSTVAFSAASFSATSFSANAHRATAHAKPLPCSHACQAVLCVKALAVRAASPSEPYAVHSSVQSLAVCPMCGWCDVCPALRWHGARRCATFKCAMLETAVLYHTSF